jgi:zinc D-Ala-D-Ala dipeptidase
MLEALLLLLTTAAAPSIPADFVDLQTVIPDLKVEVRYAGSDNFIGRPIAGYEAARVYLTRPAAAALARVQEALRPAGLGLLVYDGYRPQRAVDHFVRWGQDLADQKMKAVYYPNVDKARLFELGYIAEKSGHTRGSTVDLTLIDLASGQALDMGSPWDLFDPISAPDSREVGPTARGHRLLLRTLMVENGFRPYEAEWWHFTLENEPFPETYFDFPIASSQPPILVETTPEIE